MRLILDREHQRKLRIRLYALQKGKCSTCGKALGNQAQWHHLVVRGMGSGSRMDTIENSQLLCSQVCHDKAKKISKFSGGK